MLTEQPNQGKFSDFWMYNGILYFVYHSIPLLDHYMAKSIVQERLEFQQGRYYPVLCDTSGIQDATKLARDYLALEGSTLTKAVAIVDHRSVAKSMLELYLKRNRPLVPTAVFSDNIAAQKFLHPYISRDL